jgi:hypothetical protein
MVHYKKDDITTQAGTVSESDIGVSFANYTHMLVHITSWGGSAGNASAAIHPIGAGGGQVIYFGNQTDEHTGMRCDETWPAFDSVNWAFDDASFGSPAQIDIWLWNIADKRRV